VYQLFNRGAQTVGIVSVYETAFAAHNRDSTDLTTIKLHSVKASANKFGDFD